MNSKILIDVHELRRLLASGDCVAVDCRFDFSDPDKGRSIWLEGHLPGARYADLDKDLAAPVEDHTGRHPLPKTEVFGEFLASIGWRPENLLVAYDHGTNALSSRLWWMMKYFSAGPAALLDGGIEAWKEAGYPLESGHPTVEPASLPVLKPRPELVVTAQDLVENLQHGELLILDARAEARFAGKKETLDSKAGHIPGALNRNMDLNLGEGKRFLEPARLREEFEAALKGRDPKSVIHSCGSGVTACHNLFAMELAGLGPTRLYPGSWSEWIRDDSRPIATAT